MTYKQHKAISRYRRLAHTITEQQFDVLLKAVCFYCTGQAGGIDRLDPSKGYENNNCVASCKRCNARKSVFEHLGMEEAIRKTKELAYRNKLPPPSEREWKMWGVYKAVK